MSGLRGRRVLGWNGFGGLVGGFGWVLVGRVVGLLVGKLVGGWAGGCEGPDTDNLAHPWMIRVGTGMNECEGDIAGTRVHPRSIG